MCTYVYVRFVTGFLSFFVPLGPLTLIVVHGICRKSAAMPQCRGLVRTLYYLSNYLDLVGISAILLEIPSPDQNVIGIGRNPDFDICSDISYHMNSYDTYTKTEYT